MTTEQLRAEFEAWKSADGNWCYIELESDALEIFKAGYQAGRAALQSQPTEAFPCRIIEADFETGTVTVEIQGNYKVSAGQKYLCNAPLQSQDREDAERYRTLVASGKFVPATLSPSCLWGLRTSGTKATKAELDAAIDHARRIEGGET